MASPLPILPLLLLFLSILLTPSFSDPQLPPLEQESLYQILHSINPTIDWRSLYPSDLCYTSPHGIFCDYFTNPITSATELHVTDLNFGYVSDYSPNPPCSSNSSFSSSLTSLPFLRKLFFFKCFTQTPISLPPFLSNLSSTLEELIFIENPSLSGTIGDKLGGFKSLNKLVVTGSNVTGEINLGVRGLIQLEEIKLTKNRFSGEISNIGKLNKLRVLDLSFNEFEGRVPDSIGLISELFHLDLSFNKFNGSIPQGLVNLKRLEVLDLSYNQFSSSGVPLFLSEMVGLKEVYLSGNLLGGEIPDIWEKLGGIVGIGLSEVGLVGNIPSSMGVFLRKASFIKLDNNKLEGKIPDEFGFLEAELNELNLENNLLTGCLPFSDKFLAKIARKLKVEGNPNLCVNEGLGKRGDLKLCKKVENPNPVLVSGSSGLLQRCSFLGFLVLWFLF